MLRENKEGKKWIDLFFLVKIGSRGTWKSLSNKVNFVAWSLTFGSNICSKCLNLVTHTPTFTTFPRGYHGYPVNIITNEEGTVGLHGLHFTYRRVSSSSLSRIVAHFWIFRRLLKGKFDAYVVWPLAKNVQNLIVDRSTARNFTVFNFDLADQSWVCRILGVDIMIILLEIDKLLIWYDQDN